MVIYQASGSRACGTPTVSLPGLRFSSCSPSGGRVFASLGHPHLRRWDLQGKTWPNCALTKRKAEEVIKCALSSESPQLLKRRGAGKGAGVMGLVVPNALETAPLSSRRAHPQKGNRRGHRSGSWVEPTGCDADARRAMPRDVSRSYYGDQRVQATRHYTAALRPDAAWVHDPKRFKFRGAGRRLAATVQPKTVSTLELARPETGDDNPEARPQDRRPPSRTKNPGTPTETCKLQHGIEPAEAPC
jgi:hypothetical protein